MARHTPLHYGYYYHIYNRGNNGENIFLSQDNYRFFLKRYAHYIEPIAETFAYCLLSNHFHFSIRVRTVEEQEAYHQCFHISEKWELLDPSRQFKNFFTSYSMAFSKQQNRTGSLFEKPFKRNLVDVDDFQNWKWSSYRAFQTNHVTKLSRNVVLNWFGGQQEFLEAHQFDPDEQMIKPIIADDWL